MDLASWTFNGKAKAKPQPPALLPADEARAERRAQESVQAIERLREAQRQPPPPPVPMAPLQVQGLEPLVERQARVAAGLAELAAEEAADDAAVQERKAALTAEAAQALVEGRSAESKTFAKLQVEHAQRQDTRRLRREALREAKAAIDAKVTAHLATAIRDFYAAMRARTAELVAQQASALRAYQAAAAEEMALQQQALGEIGRVHRLLPRLELAPGWRGRDRAAAQRDPDQALVRRFLDDAYVGVPPLVTSRRAHLIREPAVREWFTAVREEGHDG